MSRMKIRTLVYMALPHVLAGKKVLVMSPTENEAEKLTAQLKIEIKDVLKESEKL